jgi:hypothetical protein
MIFEILVLIFLLHELQSQISQASQASDGYSQDPGSVAFTNVTLYPAQNNHPFINRGTLKSSSIQQLRERELIKADRCFIPSNKFAGAHEHAKACEF